MNALQNRRLASVATNQHIATKVNSPCDICIIHSLLYVSTNSHTMIRATLEYWRGNYIIVRSVTRSTVMHPVESVVEDVAPIIMRGCI